MILIPSTIDTSWYIIEGIAYRAVGWLGCQLESYRWIKPKIGERIQLLVNYNKYELEITKAERIYFRYRCTWRLPQNTDYDSYTKKIRQFYDDLRRL